METTVIEKELLGNVSFATAEVLESMDAVKERKATLDKAMLLGNGQRGKVRIYFKTKGGEELQVHTTIWAVSEKYITVKANRPIPIHSITKVELC
jgi:hypothetical protein